jgi:hypothetical protein
MRSKLGTPSSLQHTASPSMMQERETQLGQCLDDEGEAVREVARAAVELHARTLLARDDAEAVVFDLV